MYKLIILIEAQADSDRFERRWPEFLAAAERMPGLLREVTARVDRVLHGSSHVQMQHELYFESLKTAAEAMGSKAGEQAGQILQTITGGKVTLLLADHTQDDLPNIRKHTAPTESGDPPGDRA